MGILLEDSAPAPTMLHNEIERIALGDLMGEGGKRQAIQAAVDRLKQRLPNVPLPGLDPVDAQPDAQHFLEQLSERAGLVGMLDPAWWMVVADMLNEGWRIVPPSDDERPTPPTDTRMGEGGPGRGPQPEPGV